MQSTELDLTADVIDVRDIIARVEELENERDDYMVPNRDGHMTMIGADWAADNAAEAAELALELFNAGDYVAHVDHVGSQVQFSRLHVVCS